MIVSDAYLLIYAGSGSLLLWLNEANIQKKRTHMRTTLTLDNDVADYLKEQAQLLGQPFKQVVNDTLRRGMSPGSREALRPKYRVKPIHGGFAPGVDPLKLKEIMYEEDDENYLKLSRM